MIEKFTCNYFNVLVGIVDGDDPFNIDKVRPIKFLKASRNILSREPVVIIADPFLFVKEDTLYLFYEEQKGLRGKGVLKMISTRDLKNWSNPVVVLEESFHLSYPNVFEYDNNIYMMPETGHNCDVRLYRLSNDLRSAYFDKQILTGHNFVDSDIFIKEDVKYLFTSPFCLENNYKANLYYKTKHEVSWKVHPMSPYSVDCEKARCGGHIISLDGHIYRIAQNCKDHYGAGLSLYEIIELDIDKYSEKFVRRILPTNSNKFHHGGHHFSMVEFMGSKIVAIDYLSANFNVYEFISRILNKFFGK